jgi:hypothetical protein
VANGFFVATGEVPTFETDRVPLIAIVRQKPSLRRSRRNVRQRTFLVPPRQLMTVVSSIGEEMLWP